MIKLNPEVGLGGCCLFYKAKYPTAVCQYTSLRGPLGLVAALLVGEGPGSSHFFNESSKSLIKLNILN